MPLANRAVDLMELDESQNAQFEALVSIHKKDMESLNQLQKELLESYFKNVYDAENSPMNDYQLDKLQAIEGQKIESTYRHFEDIKTMLRTEQMDGFTQFMKGAMRHILMDSKLEKEPRPPRQ